MKSAVHPTKSSSMPASLILLSRQGHAWNGCLHAHTKGAYYPSLRPRILYQTYQGGNSLYCGSSTSGTELTGVEAEGCIIAAASVDELARYSLDVLSQKVKRDNPIILRKAQV